MLNTKRFLCAVFIFFILIHNAIHSEEKKTTLDFVAYVSKVTGKKLAFIQRKNTKDLKKAIFGVQLYSGDAVLAKQDTFCVLQLMDGNKHKIKPNTKFVLPEVTTQGGKTSSFIPNTINMIKDSIHHFFDKNGDMKIKGGVQGGVLRGEIKMGLKDLETISPKGNILESHPTFQWVAILGTKEYEVLLIRENKTLWKKKTAGDSISYPVQGKPLMQGVKYQWLVKTQKTGKQVVSGVSSFLILPPEQIEAIKKEETMLRTTFSQDKDDMSLPFFLGQFYEMKKLLHEAESEYFKAIDIDPKEPLLYHALFNLYMALERPQAATLTVKKLKELTGEAK